MKIVADENIPYVHELFDHFGDVKTLPGRNMANNDVIDADILLVRSVTPVNKTLLNKSAVKFVGTCTIGVDHLDVDYLKNTGITYTSAPGCNAYGVVQYVLAALAQYDRLTPNQTVGIIGCGNVGSRLYRCLKSLGFACAVYDPFLSNDQIDDLSSWDTVLQSDIICMHAPLTKSGKFPSFHMVNAEALQKMQPDVFLINAGRGAVIDNAALDAHLSKNPRMDVVLDVWEDEPDILLPLLKKVRLGSPHIAGYSFEGRTNGSLMIFNALADFLCFDAEKAAQIVSDVKFMAYGEPELVEGETLKSIILNTYFPEQDHQRLLAVANELPKQFDILRKTYPKRREFSHYRIPSTIDKTTVASLLAAGFIE